MDLPFSQVAEFFDATIAKVPDIKLAANWIMGDIAAYMKNEKLSINEIKLSPQELSDLIASIKSGTISGKIGKEVCFLLSAFIPFLLSFSDGGKMGGSCGLCNGSKRATLLP